MDAITISRVSLTVFCFVSFILLTFWIYSKRNKETMEDLGRSVLEEDESAIPPSSVVVTSNQEASKN
jgi:cbb3-type cytochrome oxidase subunit 3